MKDERYLFNLLNKKVLPRYPELSEEKNLSFTAIKWRHLPKNNLARINVWTAKTSLGTVEMKKIELALFLDYVLQNWSDLAICGIFAHEISHYYLEHYRGEIGNMELAVTQHALSRGFLEEFRETFRMICKVPCHRIENFNSNELGGLVCGPNHPYSNVYCPFKERADISYIRKVEEGNEGLCAVCESPINTKLEKWECSNCQSQFHKTCVQFLVNNEGLCPVCKAVLIFSE